MTVERNVAFGLEIAGAAPDRIRATVDSLLRKLNLTEFRDRFPKDLSGGMKQRVATLPRPRDSAALEFNELKKLVSQLVMEEQMRHASDQLRGTTAD